MRKKTIGTALGGVLIALVSASMNGGSPSAAATTEPLLVNVLSNRADLISGGDALVSVTLPSDVDPSSVRVFLGAADVTARFRQRPDGSFSGLLEGLRVGVNTVRAFAPGHAGKRTITDHPNGGPVFSGPQSRFYVCQNGAEDDQCNQPATYSYLYKSTDPTKAGLQPYDQANPPSDVATTTTDGGVTVPFVVRREDGFQDRDRYSILTLFRPGQPWAPWAPQQQWNHKVLVPHGGNCGASYAPGSPPLADISGTLPTDFPGYQQTYVAALGQGFAVMSTALNNTGHNCNPAVEAESLMMAKERLIEQYGHIRYTIGTGCSGGSIAQQTIANAYPGIYQGLTTTCSFPDTLTAAVQFGEFHLLRLYLENPSRWAPGVVWSPTQFGVVQGNPLPLDAVVADEGLFKAAVNPEHPCPGPGEPVPGDPNTRYDHATNPGGVRCSAVEMWTNLVGLTPSSMWTAQEQKVGRGFVPLPLANAGVQYGLNALKRRLITVNQFIDLNAKVGGLDVDGRLTTARIPGIRDVLDRAYRTGLVNEGSNLDQVAMINYGGPDPGLAHGYAHAWWMQDRLRRSTGTTANRVLWFGEVPLIGDPRWIWESVQRVDEWLSRVEKDTRAVPLSTKIIEDKPASLVDRCTNVPGIESVGALCRPALQTHYSSPREVAGDDVYNDRLSCQLKPLARSDFSFLLLPLTPAQWSTLQATFPNGVCDYSKPGHGQQNAQTWLTYSDSKGQVIYGGQNLPDLPANSAQGWSSPAFAPALRR